MPSQLSRRLIDCTYLLPIQWASRDLYSESANRDRSWGIAI
ncbi:hypothetical protein FAES_0405 [Fibrella aestuarina BUZ 2]|uniref:Uncharacterized protein n=1 Tax=Fibrella aestuarina BUZ 2 TaxID=1166018 RepID=I0K2R4_9BACT|nr:hypothetical protein [Fibrella aestuarina]CCG98417.1 hypothetical protein FAES_0405 [Fibrella aestuarina BUZ 2]